MENFLEVRDVVKRFEGHTALDGVSIAARRGRIFGLLGPNGAGKTTLIRIINRITAPDSGEILFDGRTMEPADVQRIGYLPEERGLYKKMHVGEQAVYFARLKGMDKGVAEERLHRWFRKFDIESWWNRKLEELSKGMQQKVQFVITVLHEPSLLIFDEPFSGFDPVNAELLKREILELKAQGHTIIFSTHNMESVEEICDDIALIDHSRVVLSGEVSEVKQRFRSGLFEVVATKGELPAACDAYEILERTPLADGTRFLIRKGESIANSDLVSTLAERVEIRSFAEQMPSMHDIFLNIVGGD